MLETLLAAFAVSAGNLAAAASIGAVEYSKAVQTRVVAAFALFEGGMPVLGVLLGEHLSEVLSSAAKPVAGAALALMGLYLLIRLRRETIVTPHPLSSGRAIVVTAALLSLDNLVVGGTLGAAGVGLLVAAATFGTVAVLVAYLGLKVGRTMSVAAARAGDSLGGTLLVALGLATATGVL